MSSILGTLQLLAAAEDMVISQHAYDRFDESGISTAEVQTGIGAAVVVEDYPDYHKGPSVLVLQRDCVGQPIHVVWGLRKDTDRPAVVITVHRPDPQRWSDDFRSRR